MNPVVIEIEVYHTQLAKVSFDQIIDIPAEVWCLFHANMGFDKLDLTANASFSNIFIFKAYDIAFARLYASRIA